MALTKAKCCGFEHICHVDENREQIKADALKNLKVYVVVEDIHYDTAEVLGVATTVEAAKEIAEAHAKKSKPMKFEAEWWQQASGGSLFRAGNYSTLCIEIHDLKGA